MDPAILKDYGLPLACCIVLCYAISLLWKAYQKLIDDRDKDQQAEIERWKALATEKK